MMQVQFSNLHSSSSMEFRLSFRIILLTMTVSWVVAEPDVPCYFVFGDSMADNGNNNPLPFSTKANFLPYGIDFQDGPTGRFSNGFTVADYIGSFLGFEKLIQPYHPLTIMTKIYKGVDYASGGAGIQDNTGLLVTHTSLRLQIRNHQTMVSRIQSEFGLEDGNKHLSQCIYSLSFGTSDYLYNFNAAVPFLQPNPDLFADQLIHEYSHHLKRLFNLGGRKFVVWGLMHLGCSPIVIINVKGHKSIGGVDSVNKAVAIFNKKLRVMVDDLNNSALHGANFTYVNAYSVVADLLGPAATSATCCELALGSFACNSFGKICTNRNSSVFFDGLNPTEATNKVIAKRAYKARCRGDAHPYDISKLASL